MPDSPSDTPAIQQAYSPPPAPKTAAPAKPGAPRKLKIPQAAWNTMIVFSFIVNAVLVIVLLVVGMLLFKIKASIAQPLIGGLHSNFVKMDDASIITTITVSDTILVNDTMPVVFDLPLSTNTVVTLTQAVAIPNTTVILNGIPIPTDIILPAGTPLTINLDLTVPVSKTIPVKLTVPVLLTVPVNIPLNRTELHEPFTNLSNLVGPYDVLLQSLPGSWPEVFGQK